MVVDPPDGTVDARQPHPPTDFDSFQGIDSILISWPDGTTDPRCRTFCETPSGAYPLNSIVEMVDNLDGTYTVHLDRPIAPGAAAVLTFLYGDGSTSSATLRAQPGNVDGIGPADMADVDALVAALNGTVPFSPYSHDLDHSGALTSRDALRLIDLFTGASGAFVPFFARPLPSCGECCAVKAPASSLPGVTK